MKRSSLDAATGVLLIDKPKGMSSHDAVRQVRRAFGQREVGHTGTLDPMATGLMVVMLGRATRVARFVEATEKVYVGTVSLGRATTTLDTEGEVTESAEVPAHLDRAAIERALASLTGEIEQTVPAFSAVKVDGERLYQKARRGEAVEAPVRRVTIHELSPLRIALPEIDIFVRCSKGTYIRTLAVQIGRALGLPAHLSMLRRKRVGQYDVAEAHPLDELTGADEELMPMRSAVWHLPELEVSEAIAADVRHGRPLPPQHDLPGGAMVAVVRQGELLAVAEVASDHSVGYACVLVSR